MKKTVALFITLISTVALTTEIHAQSALALIQFEEAEAAFSRNDYTVTVQKLNEAQRLFGSTNAPILRLRILARDQIVRGNPNYDFAILEGLRADCDAYMASFGNDMNWIDFTRETHPLCQALNTFPKTQAARVQEEERKSAERMREQQRQEQQAKVKALEDRRRQLVHSTQVFERRASEYKSSGRKGIGIGIPLLGVAVYSFIYGIADDKPLMMIPAALATGAGAAFTGGGYGDLKRSSENAKKAEITRSQLNRLSLAPMYNPNDHSVGLALNYRF